MNDSPKRPPRPPTPRFLLIFCIGFTLLGFFLPPLVGLACHNGARAGGFESISVILGLYASMLTGPLALAISLVTFAIHRWLTSKKRASPEQPAR
ncbi:hypothetical protein [Pyxidicoccus xibeiensis]|uniref:hypothetical protein n=1 Tax=Pyxidicoccus xibeiensis TaxID=2906759 RepID=UPI0020A7BF77|nr:hypothetical protein [Pyxidicoccus xibeiensis]MCP3137201.1 hypothetical protein [Pyxidicoccus xibeiensis]